MNRLFLLFAIFFSVQLTAQDSLVQNGYVTLKFPGGKKSGEGFMKEGKPEGLWKAYYETGTSTSTPDYWFSSSAFIKDINSNHVYVGM